MFVIDTVHGKQLYVEAKSDRYCHLISLYDNYNEYFHIRCVIVL